MFHVARSLHSRLCLPDNGTDHLRDRPASHKENGQPLRAHCIRASVCSMTAQMISETGPQAARKIDNQGNHRGRNDSDCARPTGREEACVPRCALIGIRASVHPATRQVSSGIGPEAARNITNQGNHRGRNEVTAQQRGSCREGSERTPWRVTETIRTRRGERRVRSRMHCAGYFHKNRQGGMLSVCIRCFEGR